MSFHAAPFTETSHRRLEQLQHALLPLRLCLNPPPPTLRRPAAIRADGGLTLRHGFAHTGHHLGEPTTSLLGAPDAARSASESREATHRLGVLPQFEPHGCADRAPRLAPAWPRLYPRPPLTLRGAEPPRPGRLVCRGRAEAQGRKRDASGVPQRPSVPHVHRRATRGPRRQRAAAHGSPPAHP